MTFGPVARGLGRDTVDTLHLCDITTVTKGRSMNVKINNIGVHRLTDLNAPHTLLVGIVCVPHSQPINLASTTVKANNLGVARVDDTYLLCGKVTSGSENVNAGD